MTLDKTKSVASYGQESITDRQTTLNLDKKKSLNSVEERSNERRNETTLNSDSTKFQGEILQSVVNDLRKAKRKNKRKKNRGSKKRLHSNSSQTPSVSFGTSFHYEKEKLPQPRHLMIRAHQDFSYPVIPVDDYLRTAKFSQGP